MSHVGDGTIDLIISGPPYWDYIDYTAYAAGKSTKRQQRRQQRPYPDYLADMRRWYRECFRVLRRGRYCVVNVGSIRRQGQCYPIPFHTVGVMEELGFEFCYEIIWHKIAGGRPDARVFVKHPYPGRYLPNNRTEYLLVFRKDSSTPFDGGIPFEEDERLTLDRFFKCETANNVWHIMPACDPIDRGHPCPFPPELPYRLIQLLSRKGELILDPFIGIGTTARAARMLNRRFIGYERENAFVQQALANLNIPLRMRRQTTCIYKTEGKRLRRPKYEKIYG